MKTIGHDKNTYAIDWLTIDNLISVHKKCARVQIRGVSMYPTVFSGDLVTIAPIDNHLPKQNELLFTWYGGRYNIHRFIESSGTTRGDNLLTNDPQPERIIGRVVRVERTFKSNFKRMIYLLLCFFRKILTA